MTEWYQINDIKLLIILGISLLWIIAGYGLYALIGVKHGPEGGIDQIANAIVYVFFWKVCIYIIPFIFSGVSLFLWLYQKHSSALKWVIAAIVAGCIFYMIYQKHLRKRINTPESISKKLPTYEDWCKTKLNKRWTESDLICRYIHDIVSDAILEFRRMYPDGDIMLKTAYINAALEAHFRELPHVEGWEYIHDIRERIPQRKDQDGRFLLKHTDFCVIADHYNKALRRDHWYDRYIFVSSPIVEWYSWLPMIIILYDDGTMDITIAT